jgi:hypothetical protein
VTVRAAPVMRPTAPARAERPADRWGWLCVGLITAVVAATWAPRLTLLLGDSHAGRVDSRYALHLRNLQTDGLLGSTFGAGWEPYVRSPYAHHPPLRNMLDALFGSLPGDYLYQIRIAPFLLALLAIPAAAALLRGLGIRWVATLLATGLMVVTGYFWIYAPLRYDLGIILALSALVVQVRRRPHPSRWLVVATGIFALLAALQSWPGIAFAIGLCLWLAVGRRASRATVVAGAGAALGVAVSLAYVFGIHGFGRMAEQAELRTGGAGPTVGALLNRLWEHFATLAPPWYQLLLPIAVAAGLWDRRTRSYTALAAVFAAGWVLVLNNGAYIHDYWSFLVLLPGLAGMGALFDWLATQLRPAVARLGLLAAGAGLAVALAVMVFGGTAQEYLYRPTDAGRLVVDNPPPPGQEYAWYGRFDPPRWLAYYWDLPPRPLTPQLLASQARPGDVVMVKRDQLPDWWPGWDALSPVAQEGDYALFRIADLRAAVSG